MSWAPKHNLCLRLQLALCSETQQWIRRGRANHFVMKGYNWYSDANILIFLGYGLDRFDMVNIQ